LAPGAELGLAWLGLALGVELGLAWHVVQGLILRLVLGLVFVLEGGWALV
jgi:hypothetical protein